MKSYLLALAAFVATSQLNL